MAKNTLTQHPQRVKRHHEADLMRGAGGFELPWALARTYPNAGREWRWQRIFPATRFHVDGATGRRRRRHLRRTVLQRTVTEAVRRVRLAERATPQKPFRHSSATHLLEDGKDIRTVKNRAVTTMSARP